jgi:hypothetical protein
MSTTPASALQKTLERLAKMNSANAKTATKSTIKYFKPKAGKNNILILPTPFGSQDPFLEWGTHKNLLDQPYKDVACIQHNKGEECVICQVVEDLKKQDWKGNYDIWKPLELKLRYFSPIINLDDMSSGVQWWGYGKSVLSQFENWLLNLEEDETAFYDLANPEKIIINYNPEGAPTDMYKLDKKAQKPFGSSQVEEWQSDIKPLSEIFTYEMPQDKVLKALETYMERVKGQLDATDVEADAEEEEEVAPKKIGKLDKLK